MAFTLVTFDAYSGLADFRATLLPVVGDALALDGDRASEFLAAWRARQLEAAALSNALGTGRVSFHECTALGLDHTLARHGLAPGAAAREALIRAWYPLRPWPEAPGVLAELRARGYALALLSNGDRAMLDAIAGELPVAIDHVFSTETAGVYKPAPAVYDLPLAALGIPRDGYLHVAGGAGDVIGAKAAGVACYWNNRTADRVLYPQYAADHEGPDLSGLLDIL